MRLLIVLLFLTGCGHSSLKNPYPVSAKYGLHTYHDFENSKCWGIDPEVCEMMFWHRFTDELIKYYGDTGFNMKTCSLTDLCLNDISFESEYRR